ncbi:MAG: hypothetical protein B6I31_00825 [Desulfobacteraceae bacterium 4572_19]|nr:MAG: hypothetical protein B6I31_00825 [Desulfobacteraceae bacterium 4572_19]
MSIFNNTIEEYIFLNQQSQGNVNIPGLVFDDLLDESLSLTDRPLTVNVEMVESGLDFTESLEPVHDMFLWEELTFSEMLGFPARVKQVAINVIHQPIVSPIDLCFMQVDIIHGVDVFREEVSSALHFPTESDDIARISQYSWPVCYESIDFEFEMTEGTPGVTKVVYGVSDSLINFRHTIEAEWFFNSISLEQLFLYDEYKWGWGHKIDESMALYDYTYKYLGFKILEYLFLNDAEHVHTDRKLFLNDNVFIYDTERHGLILKATDSIEMSDAMIVPYIERLLDGLSLTSDIEQSYSQLFFTLQEQVKLSGNCDVLEILLPVIYESLKVSDYETVMVHVQQFFESIAEVINIDATVQVSNVISKLIEDAVMVVGDVE